MRRPRWFTFDLRALGHPVWWAALALLAANDHLLKRAGVLPGWLTGKLSDFAFLIVAPVLLASLVPSAVRPRRALALLSTAGLFAAAKVSPAVSGMLVSGLRQLGISWRLWTDPTDLVALAIVPVSIALMRAAARPSNRRRTSVQRAGVVLGAAACLATSAPPRFQHNAFLLNAAPGPVSVTATWLLRAVPCGAIGQQQNIDDPSPIPADLASELVQTLTPGDLDDPIALDLQRGQVAALDGPPPAGATPTGVCATEPRSSWESGCVGVVLDAPPATPVLVLAPAQWDEAEAGGIMNCGSPSAVSRCQPTLDPTRSAGPDAVTLREVDGVLQFVAGAKLRLAPIDPAVVAGRASPAGNCRALRDRYSALVQAQPCASDADCVAVEGLPIPGAAAACGADLNLPGASAAASLRTSWEAACVTPPAPDCPPVQPAVCRAGTCAAVCPGEQIPTCPRGCYDSNGSPGAACTGVGTPCARADGLWCTCVNGIVACAPPQPSSATCPLPCNDPPGGGSYVGGVIRHPALDGGTAAAPDAGARD